MVNIKYSNNDKPPTSNNKFHQDSKRLACKNKVAITTKDSNMPCRKEVDTWRNKTSSRYRSRRHKNPSKVMVPLKLKKTEP